MYNNKNSNERYKDLCGRLVCWLGETEEGAELYDTLHTEIGMTDDEVSEIGFTSLASYFTERQDELSVTMEERQLGIRTVAQFRRKEPVLQQDECEIEKVVELTREEFHHFKNNLLDDYDFISENSDLMCVDKNGTTHCILVLGDDYDEGILVNSEGSSYARYSALLPNARSFIEKQMGQETKLTLYDLWYESKYAILKSYTKHLPPQKPLSQEETFKPIRNAVIREALKLSSDQQAEDTTQRVSSSGDTTSSHLPVTAITRVMKDASRIIEDKINGQLALQPELAVDSKLRREIAAKKRGIRLKM